MSKTDDGGPAFRLNYTAARRLQNAIGVAIDDIEKDVKAITKDMLGGLPERSARHMSEQADEKMEAVRQLRDLASAANKAAWATAITMNRATLAASKPTKGAEND